MNTKSNNSVAGAAPGQARIEMRHTYINTGGVRPDPSVEAADMDFLTDANVYYNLPPPLPSGRSRGASLPRGHLTAQNQPLTRAYSSCPASPKLPPSAVVSRKNNVPSLRPQSNQEKDLPSPSLKQQVPNPRHKKLSHTRSFDLDHLYQNLVRVACKPRSNSFSIDLPWRRKKKAHDTSTSDIKEDAREDGMVSSTQPASSELTSCISEPCQSSSSRHIPETRGGHSTYNSSSSSSSTSSSCSSSSESEDILEDCSTEVCPGVTYLRDTVQRGQADGSRVHDDAVNSWYHTAATLPLRANKDSRRGSGSQQSIQQRQALDINANLDEWLRKERWLEKKRSSRNLRLAGESAEVDIAILYASDGDKWKNYLYDVFTQRVPQEEGYRGVRIEMKNVEEIKDDIGRLEAVKLKGAKLQIIILSPCFLAHIAEHGRSELGQVFKPEKVLALLLGIDDSQFTMAHRSALYSYNDWHRLAVRNRDMSFIYEVFYEGISILNNCELYCGYRDESSARFKVTPRKVNTIQQQVYIMLSDPVNRDDVEVLIEGPNEVSTIKKWRLRNPYTIEFRMPEKFLRGSSLLFVTVLVDKVVIGSRQLKCESNMDALRDILGSVTNPTDFMCQALNISPTSDELDHKLAVSVKLHLPCNKLEESKVQNRDGSKFPTWIHFSAYYGLERLTWALLEIPGGEAALNSPNCNGHTPSVLAYQRGFSSLAHALEDAAMVSSLAAKVGYMPTNEGKLNMPGDTLVNEGTYNSPPPPRPLKASQTSGYDPLPAPREVSCTSPSGTEIPEMMVTPPPPPPLSPALNDICDARWEAVHSPELPPPPLPESSSQHLSPLPPQEWTKDRNSVKQEERYLDMNVSGNCNDGKVCEYSADVYTLVTAWMEKTNIKTFVEKHQEKIVELKNKLDSDKMKEHTNEPAVSDAEAGAAALPQRGTTDQNERSSPDSARQKTMVGQFFGLLLRGRRKQPLHLDLEGSRSLCDLPPNDYSDDPTHSSPMKETSSETDNETSSVPVIPPRKLSDPTESSLPASHDSVSISPGPARGHKLVKLENKKHAMEAMPKSRLLTEERLPQPPPRSEQSYDPYLPIEDINVPKYYQVKSHQEEMSRSTSNLVKTNNSLQKKKSFSGSKTPSPQTKKMDDDEELDYVTVN